eukprot:5895103-Prymnesium_polylepis.2
MSDRIIRTQIAQRRVSRHGPLLSGVVETLSRQNVNVALSLHAGLAVYFGRLRSSTRLALVPRPERVAVCAGRGRGA